MMTPKYRMCLGIEDKPYNQYILAVTKDLYATYLKCSLSTTIYLFWNGVKISGLYTLTDMGPKPASASWSQSHHNTDQTQYDCTSSTVTTPWMIPWSVTVGRRVVAVSSGVGSSHEAVPWIFINNHMSKLSSNSSDRKAFGKSCKQDVRLYQKVLLDAVPRKEVHLL